MCGEEKVVGPVDWKDHGIKLVFGVQDFLSTEKEMAAELEETEGKS
jgi:hypothetical protein